jgi:hypothetical protein
MINILQYRTIVAALVAFVGVLLPIFGLDPQIATYIEKGGALLALVFLRLGFVKAVEEIKAAQK